MSSIILDADALRVERFERASGASLESWSDGCDTTEWGCDPQSDDIAIYTCAYDPSCVRGYRDV